MSRQFALVRVAVGAVALARGLAWAIESPEVILLPWIVLAVMVAAGARGRLAALGMVLLAPFVVVAGFFEHHLYLLWLMLILVSVSDSEQHFALWPQARSEVASWPLFLMRCQLSIVYVSAGLAKLNPEFLSGDVLRFLYDRAPTALPDAAMAPLALATAGTELFIGVVVWSRLRGYAFALMLPLHLGMATIAMNLDHLVGVTLFAVLMATLASTFLDTTERTVVWDDRCSFCHRWVAAFRRLDLTGSLRFIGSSDPGAYETGVRPEAAAEAMQVVAVDGIHGGYDAVRRIVAVLPAGFLIAPWMGLPGVRHLGHAAYRAVAARRTCRYEPARA